jgi:hypothetical protein
MHGRPCCRANSDGQRAEENRETRPNSWCCALKLRIGLCSKDQAFTIDEQHMEWAWMQMEATISNLIILEIM